MVSSFTKSPKAENKGKGRRFEDSAQILRDSAQYPLTTTFNYDASYDLCSENNEQDNNCVGQKALVVPSSESTERTSLEVIIQDDGWHSFNPITIDVPESDVENVMNRIQKVLVREFHEYIPGASHSYTRMEFSKSGHRDLIHAGSPTSRSDQTSWVHIQDISPLPIREKASHNNECVSYDEELSTKRALVHPTQPAAEINQRQGDIVVIGTDEQTKNRLREWAMGYARVLMAATCKSFCRQIVQAIDPGKTRKFPYTRCGESLVPRPSWWPEQGPWDGRGPSRMKSHGKSTSQPHPLPLRSMYSEISEVVELLVDLMFTPLLMHDAGSELLEARQKKWIDLLREGAQKTSCRSGFGTKANMTQEELNTLGDNPIEENTKPDTEEDRRAVINMLLKVADMVEEVASGIAGRLPRHSS